MNNKTKKSKSKTNKNKKWNGGYISSSTYSSQKKRITLKKNKYNKYNKKTKPRQSVSSSILAIQMNTGI
jgi:hypothetical protein